MKSDMGTIPEIMKRTKLFHTKVISNLIYFPSIYLLGALLRVLTNKSQDPTLKEMDVSTRYSK
jgi:hypothetical protein